jgi:hypothetical protein
MTNQDTLSLSPDQLHTLRHMLGITDPSLAVPKPYRNYYAANPGDEHMAELERLGAVKMTGTRWDLIYYECTEAGTAAAIASFKTIQLSKGKRVYRAFLNASDVAPDLTFREFLTNPAFKGSRDRS